MHYVQKTIIQTHDPADGDRYVTVAELDGISLPVDPYTPLTIDGERWAVVRASVSLDRRSPQCVVTTVTAIQYDGS